jgi:peptide/nickel transport system substrate-binding protein
LNIAASDLGTQSVRVRAHHGERRSALKTRLWLAAALLAVGAGLLVAAGFAGPAAGAAAAPAKAGAVSGGTLNVELSTDTDYTDPALAYLASSWELEYATCLKLLNYPDSNGPQASQLVAEGASGMPRVSKDGRTYDFTVNASFTKFSNGQPVTAANFAAALNRDANPKMQSPATSFISDVVGAQEVFDGRAQTISGVKVRGKHLLVTLRNPAPDFLARIAMPFFCAIPTNLPIDSNGVEELPAAGPYYVADRTPNKAIVLKRNPFYKGKRPHNPTQIVYTIGNSLEAIRLRVEQGATDYAAQGIPPAAYAEVAQKYGINKGQFWVKPQLGVSYLSMNHDREIFKNNVPLMKAINYAIDRRALLAQSGFLAGKRTDQILPPGMAGFQNADLYPTKAPNIDFAKKIAQGHLRDGKIVFYTSNRGAAPLQAQIVQFNLKQIGLDVEVRQFSRAVQITKEGTRGEPFDMGNDGWIADYADPYDFINVLLSGDGIQESNNNNYSYFNDPTYNKKMRDASRLFGSARYKAYGALDVEMMKNAAPIAPRSNPNARVFVSKRFGCFTFSPIYTVDLAAACIKK